MSEPLIPSTSEESYQPISGFALGGLSVAAGFAALVLLSALVAVVKGAPIFFPLWLLLAPIVAFVLCLMARNQIVGSDGTRAGLRLANWGLALALFSGLGYAAYYITIGMAVAKQANDFVMGDPELDSGFLTRVVRGGKTPIDLDIAFLLTRPATGRIRIRPGDDAASREAIGAAFDQSSTDAGAGEVTRFRGNIMVRMLARAADRAVIEPLGVQEWSHDKASYKVARNYRLTLPEGIIDVTLQAESTEPEAEGERRRWFINLNRSPIVKKELTPMGQVVSELKDQSRDFVENAWRSRVAEGKAFAEVAKSDTTDWKRLFPDTPERIKGGKNIPREVYRKQWHDYLAGKGSLPVSVNFETNIWPHWGLDGEGRFWIEQPLRLMLSGGGEAPPMSAEGTARVRTREPVDPSKLSPPAPIVDWEVDEVAILRARSPKGM